MVLNNCNKGLIQTVKLTIWKNVAETESYLSYFIIHYLHWSHIHYYTLTYLSVAILQSPCPPALLYFFVADILASIEKKLTYFVYCFYTMICTVSPLFRFLAQLLPVCRSTIFQVMHNRKFCYRFRLEGIWYIILLLHGDLFFVSPFQFLLSHFLFTVWLRNF